MKTKQELINQLSNIELSISAQKHELIAINRKALTQKDIENTEKVIKELRITRRKVLDDLKIYKREERAEKRSKPPITGIYSFKDAPHGTDPYQWEYTSKEVVKQKSEMKEIRSKQLLLFKRAMMYAGTIVKPSSNGKRTYRRTVKMANKLLLEGRFDFKTLIVGPPKEEPMITKSRAKVINKVERVMSKVKDDLEEKVATTKSQKIIKEITKSRNFSMSNIKQAA